jgi:maleylacetoacetate isomerase
VRLYSFFRSSASHRVRIALALKDLPYTLQPVPLALHGGAQQAPDYAAVNTQQLVPALVDGDVTLTQSLAIFDHLDRRQPAPPLFPEDVAGRARVWSLCLFVACEIQPLQNLRVERYLDQTLHLDAAARTAFKRHFQDAGFDVVEQMLQDGHTGEFGHGDAPGAVDCMLVPQAAAVLRTGGTLDAWPTIARVVAACNAHPAFVAAAPENQPDRW